MTDAVLAAERAYVAAALSNAPLPTDADPLVHAACAGAVASRYLAVGTPRSFAVIADDPRAAELSLASHRTWFAPRDLRATCDAPGFRRVALDEALAADIVCVHTPLAIAAGQLRRGTHVNVLAPCTIDPALVATIAHEQPDLGRLAAGLVDGRQLDEITLFICTSSPDPRSAPSSP